MISNFQAHITVSDFVFYSTLYFCTLGGASVKMVSKSDSNGSSNGSTAAAEPPKDAAEIAAAAKKSNDDFRKMLLGQK